MAGGTLPGRWNSVMLRMVVKWFSSKKPENSGPGDMPASMRFAMSARVANGSLSDSSVMLTFGSAGGSARIVFEPMNAVRSVLRSTEKIW